MCTKSRDGKTLTKCGALTAAPLVAGSASASATGTAPTNAVSRLQRSSPPHATARRLTLDRRGGPVDENAFKDEAPDASRRGARKRVLPRVLSDWNARRTASRRARDTLTAPRPNTQTTLVKSTPDVGPEAGVVRLRDKPLARSSIPDCRSRASSAASASAPTRNVPPRGADSGAPRRARRSPTSPQGARRRMIPRSGVPAIARASRDLAGPGRRSPRMVQSLGASSTARERRSWHRTVARLAALSRAGPRTSQHATANARGRREPDERSAPRERDRTASRMPFPPRLPGAGRGGSDDRGIVRALLPRPRVEVVVQRRHGDAPTGGGGQAVTRSARRADIVVPSTSNLNTRRDGHFQISGRNPAYVADSGDVQTFRRDVSAVRRFVVTTSAGRRVLSPEQAFTGGPSGCT